jgi:hypothetical protein
VACSSCQSLRHRTLRAAHIPATFGVHSAETVWTSDKERGERVARQLEVGAVVLGASMGGLLAARVLAGFYDRVTVVERDTLPTDPVNRRGVPQGRLIHAALARCTHILDELFPGFVDELTAMGVGSWDDGDLSKLWLADIRRCAPAGHRIQR